MREILFRGKRKDNDEWVEGLLGYCNFNHGVEKAIYVATRMGSITPYRIKQETVGQYTGLTDKNDKKIFEGDIVEFTCRYTGNKGRAKIVFEAFKWKYNGCYYGGNPIVWLCINDTSIEFEIIGNIHDNPELLEVEE